MPCCQQDVDNKQPAAGGAPGGGLMAMGMGKKMMAQMGQGGGQPPKMGQGGEQQPMQQMMGMCAEMLGAIRQTTAMAAFATPALEHMLGEWLKDLEDKAEAALAAGEKDAAALATALGIDEDSALYVLGRLAANGKVTLVARPRT